MRSLGVLSARGGLVVAGALIGVVGIADNLTGVEISFSIFYLLPVSLAGWIGGRWIGFVFAVICARGSVWSERQPPGKSRP